MANIPLVQSPPVRTEASPLAAPVIPMGKGHAGLGVTALWPIVDYIWDIGNGKILPLPNTNLSDAWVYLAIPTVAPAVRGKRLGKYFSFSYLPKKCIVHLRDESYLRRGCSIA
jgi:hypothetical protein